MKRITTAILLVLAGWQSHSALAADEAKLSFETYSGYFVSNRFEPDAAKSFVVVADREQFDKVFGVAMVMGDKSHRLAKDAFASNLVLAAVNRGKAVWTFHVGKITVDRGVVQFQYSSKASETTAATFACPLIVSIPKGRYKAVQFIENMKRVKTIEMGGK